MFSKKSCTPVKQHLPYISHLLYHYFLPQPMTPSPLISVVCESVPNTVSGYTKPSLSTHTIRAKYSSTAWLGKHEPGGTTVTLPKV